MNVRSIAATLFTFPLALSLSAQGNCPHEKTQHVEATLKTGPAQKCGGVDYKLGDLHVSTIQDGCLQFAIYTPGYDIAVTSPHATMVEVVSLQPVTTMAFGCKQDWFLFFPIGSSCALMSQTTGGSVPLMVTRPCELPRP